MTATERAMTDEPEAQRGPVARIALIALGSLGAIFGVGVTTGILFAHFEHEDATIGPKLAGLLVAAFLFTAGAAWLAWRNLRLLAEETGEPTTREKRNRLVLVACGAAGLVIGMALTIGGGSPLTAFSNDPLPTWLAVLLALPIAVLLPLISLYWHRHVVDEQEAAAYSKGALVGINIYFVGAPTWWLLWRGGLLPAPDGIVIYFTTVTVTGLVWLWAKYR